MSHDENFEAVGSGASQTFPQQCSALRKNGYVVIKNRPCKIVEMSTSKTGKHGHAKVHMVALDIFTGKKYEDICPSTHNMNVPNVVRDEYLLNDINSDNYLDLMNEFGEQREDIKVPTGSVGDDLIKKHGENPGEVLVTVQKAMGEESVITFKVTNKAD